MKKLLANGCLVIATMILGLVCCEIALRVATVGFEWRNYAVAPVNTVRMIGSVQFDPELGYTPLPNRMDIGFGPIGNRLNHRTVPSDPVPALPSRPILTLGDSFTYGSEVEADQSWPAQLERTLGTPVVNAGVGGYGIDQMVLLGERIVSIVKPRLIILSFIPNDIDRVRASIFSGVPKPYFTVENGSLALRNVPITPLDNSHKTVGWTRTLLGYSYLVDLTMDRLGFASWWRKSALQFQLEKTDPVEISCLLMARLKRLADRTSVPIVVVGQNGWSDFTVGGRTARDQQVSVLNCARAQGLAVSDMFDTMAALLVAEGREPYYVNGVGHMTEKGNAVVAQGVAQLVRKDFSGLLN